MFLRLSANCPKTLARIPIAGLYDGMPDPREGGPIKVHCEACGESHVFEPEQLFTERVHERR